MSEEKEPISVRQEAENTLLNLGQLTVLRSFSQRAPVVHLTSLCEAIVIGDALGAIYAYHAMTAALLDSPCRRVTGNIWRDFVFSEVLERPNRFSQLAAEERYDPPVNLAMTHDLELMQSLFAMEADTWIEGIATLSKERKIDTAETAILNQAEIEKHSKRLQELQRREERISKLSVAAWGANPQAQRNEDNNKQEEPAIAEVVRPIQVELPEELSQESWIGWDYDEPGDQVEYVADEALALVYRRFLAEGNWGELTEALQEFHAHYGDAEFLRYRFFVAMDNGFVGLEQIDLPEWDEIVAVDSQKEQFYANVLRFVHTGNAPHTLLYGADGMGKTSTVLAMINDMPELRLVFLAQHDEDAMFETILMLSHQPFPFIALIDDFTLSERQYEHMKRSSALLRSVHNVLLVATSKTVVPDHSLFGQQIEFFPLDFGLFYRATMTFLRRMGSNMDQEEVRNICEQETWQDGGYSVRAAKMLAERLIRREQQQ